MQSIACISFLFVPVLLEITRCEWCQGADRLTGWQRPPEASPDGTARSWGLAAPLKKTSKKKKKKPLQCWLVQDGCDVHKWLTWIEGWCSMKTKRHLLAYQLHGKQWHFPFGSAWPSSKREEDHSSRSEVTLQSECLFHVDFFCPSFCK